MIRPPKSQNRLCRLCHFSLFGAVCPVCAVCDVCAVLCRLCRCAPQTHHARRPRGGRLSSYGERDVTPQVGQIVPHLSPRDGQTVPPLTFHPALECRFASPGLPSLTSPKHRHLAAYPYLIRRRPI